MKCIFKNKYLKHLDRFDIQAYDSTTGLPVSMEDCEDCPKHEVECRSSISWTYGIDNTGTTYDWPNAEYELTLSDGSTIPFFQTTASNGGWTAQLTELAASLQSGFDAAGVVAFAEPRTVNNLVPSDISGNYGSTPTGLPGAPSVAIAEALISEGMAARYINIQICPGQPVPVSARVVSHGDSPRFGGAYDNSGRVDYQLTTAGAILGQKERFKVCVECDAEEDVWYIFDKTTGLYRPATSGEIPDCWEPCGTYTLADPPPDRSCEFFIDLACDNNGQNDPNNFTNQITRRATVCNGEQIALEYFEEDPTDPTALVDYTLVGDFVDCTTGEIVELPEVGGVIVDCDNTNVSESFDQDVRLVGAKNPIPVFQVAQCGDYIRTEDVKLCEVDARFLLLIDSGGVFARYSFITETWEPVSTLSVASAGGSADVENFLLYNFVAPDQMTVIDVNTDTQLPNVTLVDGVINPAVTTNPKNFAAASFRDADGKLYAQDTGGADAGLYCVDVTTGEVDFVAPITGVAGSGTSIAIDNTTDTLYVNGYNFSYEVDWVTGVATQAADPPIQPNGSTFDTDGNWYVTQGPNTYYLPAGADGNNPGNWIQIIDDFSAGANSIAYYEVEAASPSCFFRRYGILENGDREIIGDFNVTDDSPRTVVGEVDCCGCPTSDSGSTSSQAPIQDIEKYEICAGGKTVWLVESLSSGGVITTTFEDETGVITTPTSWVVGACDCAVVDYYEIEGITGTLRNREWSGVFTTTNQYTTENGRARREAHDFTLPPDVDNTSTNLNLNDTDNTGGVGDIQIREGFIVVDEGAYYRYTTNSEGYYAFELGVCGGELALLSELGKGVGVNTDPHFFIPKGIHRVRVWNVDTGGSNSNWTLQKSINGNWANAVVSVSETEPTQTCKQGFICDSVYYELDKTTPIVFSETVSLCELTCNSSNTSGAGDGGTASNVTVDNFPDQCPEIDLTLSVQTGNGNIPAGFKSVTINNLSGITTINGGFELGTGRRVDSISFGTDRSNCTNELLPAYTIVSTGSHQWIGHL